jgi:DNA-directed RNA polymerase subunit RPC12/RpoP
MERNLNPSKLDSDSHMLPETHENSRCDTCGEEFEQPLFAVVSSGYLIEEYYACPRCLSKVGGVERPKNVEAVKAEDDQSQETAVEIEVDKMEETVACPHYLGYLKKRQKNSPIPEGCLTCNKIIECMSY